MITNPIQPMLAIPMAKGEVTCWTEWAAEQKFDGHRCVVYNFDGVVTGFSRPRKRAGSNGKKTMEVKLLPAHLVAQIAKMPRGIYDGELLARLPDGKWGTATDVTRTDLQDRLHYVVFDVLKNGAVDTLQLSYDERRNHLELMIGTLTANKLSHVLLASSASLASQDDVETLAKAVWDAGGEGLILKRRAAHYQQGKRSTDMIKLKRLEHGVGVVIGFEATEGTKMNRGEFAKVKVRTDDGHELTMKTCDDDQLREFERQAKTCRGANANEQHPSLGRRLMFNYPFRTREGNYQGPIIWDRWEDE